MSTPGPAPVGRLGTIGQLEARLQRTLTGAERDAAEAALADAAALAETIVTVPDPVPAAVIAVVLKAARRGFENPQGAVSETIGVYSYRLSNGGGEVNSGVYFTEAEAASLRRAVGAGSRVGTIALGIPTGHP